MVIQVYDSSMNEWPRLAEDYGKDNVLGWSLKELNFWKQEGKEMLESSHVKQ